LKIRFQRIAIGAPFVKLVGMARSPIAAAMVGKTMVVAFRKDSFCLCGEI